MKALILLVPIGSIALIWFLVVRYRGKLSKTAANTVGVILGLIVGILVLSAVLPDLSEAEKAKIESDRKAQGDAEHSEKLEADRLRAVAADVVKRQAPQSAIDRITLVYINHKVYSSNPVHCTSKVFGQRTMVGCMANTLDGYSAPHVWLFDEGKFKSVNGTARGLAETQFSNEPDIAVMKLPLPADIDVGAAVESFKKG